LADKTVHFDLKKRNYNVLNNIKEFYNEDISKNLVNFTKTKNYFQKVTQLFKLHNYLFKEDLNTDTQIEEQEKLPNINEGSMKNSNEGEQLMTVIFITEDHKVHYSFICKKTDKFQELESKLYKIYPEYAKTDNHFAVNGRTITKSKNLDDNEIKNSDIITLYCDK
jgi:molybdopterin converting factor small subunit